MALYAIGDLHLHFQSPLKARAQMRERVWKNHEEVFRRNCEALLRADERCAETGRAKDLNGIDRVVWCRMK